MISRNTLERVRERYLEEKPKYDTLAEFVASGLKGRLNVVAPSCQVTHRAKAVDSLLKKAITKDYQNPYDEIRDKAGVKVIVPFADDLGVADECVTGLFYVQSRQDKRDLLDDQSLAYRGTHFEVSLIREQVAELGDTWFQDKVCEIQLHTQARTFGRTSHTSFSTSRSQSCHGETGGRYIA